MVRARFDTGDRDVLRVAIDGKPLVSAPGGIARYVEGLLAGLAAITPERFELTVVTPTRRRRTVPWVLWSLQRATRGGAVFHFPFYYPPLWPRGPFTVTVHDTLVFDHPEWFPAWWAGVLRLLVPRGARRAGAVITPSRTVADAVHVRCRVPRERIHAIPLGVDAARFAPAGADAVAAVRQRLGLRPPYLLQVGPFEPRRGVGRAIAATQAVRTRLGELELVLAGAVRAPVAALDAPPPWVRRLGWVADGDLCALYSGAAAVLAPSSGEGFDLSVLEALSCGAAVVASRIPAHVELYDGAVELFPDGDVAAMAAAIERVLSDDARRQHLRSAARAAAACFTWEAAARRHVEVWRAVAENRGA